MMAIFTSFFNSFISCARVRPSLKGIFMSSNTRSGNISEKTLKAELPSSASYMSFILYFSKSMKVFIPLLIIGSSSTIRILYIYLTAPLICPAFICPWEVLIIFKLLSRIIFAGYPRTFALFMTVPFSSRRTVIFL